MSRPVAHLRTPRPSIDSLIKRLRIPKARQKELRAIMDEGRKEMARREAALQENDVEPKENFLNASSAR